jgi:hypothetical protein
VCESVCILGFSYALVVFTYIDGSSVFKTVPSERQRCNLIHGFKGKMWERDKGLKGAEEIKKMGNRLRY